MSPPARRTARAVLVGVLGLVLVLTGACTARPAGVLAGAADLDGARVVVGGGPTDELKILCQLTVAAVEAAGGTASDQCARYGAVDVRLPAERTFVDTGWAYLSRTDGDLDRRDDPTATPADLARADAAVGVTRLAPTAFSDTDAVVVSAATAGSGIRTVSQLLGRPGAWCAPPGSAADRLAATYRPPGALRPLDEAAAFVGVARGGCTAALVRGTSGRIPALGLVPLVDDRGALGTGGAVPVVRSDVVASRPGLRAVLGVLTPRLTDDVMRELNRRVTQSGRDARDVAREWLRDQGLS